MQFWKKLQAFKKQANFEQMFYKKSRRKGIKIIDATQTKGLFLISWD